MTLKLKCDLEILKMYLHMKNKVATSRHLKLLTLDEIYALQMKKYENSSRSNVTNFQPLLVLNMEHITSTKLHQVLISSFRDFVRTDRHTDTETHRQGE